MPIRCEGSEISVGISATGKSDRIQAQAWKESVPLRLLCSSRRLDRLRLIAPNSRDHPGASPIVELSQGSIYRGWSTLAAPQRLRTGLNTTTLKIDSISKDYFAR